MHSYVMSRRFGILGGVKFPSLGTFSEYIVVERDQVIQTPDHLDDIQAAAWPLGGLTAWRFATLLTIQYRETLTFHQCSHGQCPNKNR
jgi:NADPH:quinone reductase-like Zn-dependent oxidoreductase